MRETTPAALLAFLVFTGMVCGQPRGFHDPVRLKGGETPIALEAPGYASPCLADVTGDGKADLLVGQFAGGKIMVYPGLGEGRFGKGTWLMAEGKVAEVPGVW